MTAIVVDASVLFKIYANEKDSSVALQLVDRVDLGLEAPDLLVPEVVNALIRRERDGVLASWIVDRAVADLLSLIPRLVPSSTVLDAAIRIAREMRHPIYDCIYLALAERLDVPFVTGDEELVRRCRIRIPARGARVVALSEFRA